MAGGVELGFAEAVGPGGAWRLRSAHFPSKVGGRPAWLGEAGLPGSDALRCGRCLRPRAFLLQLYAPLPGRPDAFHRTLFVFACRGAACYRLPGPGGPLCGEPGAAGGEERPLRSPPPPHSPAASSPQRSGASCRAATPPTPRSRPPKSPRRSPSRSRGGSAAAPLCAACAAAWDPAPAGAAAAPPTAAPSTRRWTGGAGIAAPAGRAGTQVGPGPYGGARKVGSSLN